MKQPRAEATRQNVLLAAAQVFEREGFAAATIAEIMNVGGVTKGALYFHFDSKEVLAQAIIDEQSNWRDAVLNSDCSPLQRMVDLSFRFARALQDDPLLRASIRLTLERATFAQSGQGAYEGWLTRLTELLHEADAAGQLRAGLDPDDAAYVVTSAVTGTQLVSEAFTQRADLTQRIEVMWQILLPGLTDDAHRHDIRIAADEVALAS